MKLYCYSYSKRLVNQPVRCLWYSELLHWHSTAKFHLLNCSTSTLFSQPYLCHWLSYLVFHKLVLDLTIPRAVIRDSRAVPSGSGFMHAETCVPGIRGGQCRCHPKPCLFSLNSGLCHPLSMAKSSSIPQPWPVTR